MKLFRIALFAALAPMCAAHASANENDVRRYDANAEPKVTFAIKESVKPLFPFSLKQRGYEEGEVIYALYIDQFGQLADYLLLKATHLDFAEAVERVLPQWDYSVPYADGETTALVSTVKVTFERGGGVVYETTGIDLTHFFGYRFDDEIAYRIYGIWELDNIPEPIEIVRPNFHTDLLEERDLVNAVFEFYIDTEGNVRMPTLREADDRIDERLLVIAQEALLRWKFAAPTVDNKPVVARAAQPFRFKKGENGGVVE